MRSLLLILSLSCLLASGCSSMVSGSGLELRKVTSQEQVHAEFGSPKKTELVDGQLVEHYVTRRKLKENDRATGEI